jgi:hypothetical protein
METIMGDITFSRVIDDAQAKATARTIQKRLADFGNTISYGHALEAAAAVFGHSNWPTLQAAIKVKTLPEQARLGGVGRLPAKGIPSFGEQLRSIAFIGDYEARKQALNAIVAEVDSAQRSLNEDVARYVIDVSGYSNDHVKISLDFCSGKKQYRIQPGRALSRFNLFDLAVGDRQLKVGCARDQKVALLHFLFAGAPNRYTRRVLAGVLEDLYERFSDPQHSKTQVRAYAPGIDTDIDTKLAGQIPNTWWDVAEVLRHAGHASQARKAEFLAAPKFEDYVELAAEITPDSAREAYYDERGKLDVACQFIRERAPQLLRGYPFLNCVTNVETSSADGLICLIPSDASATTKAVMYALSIHQCQQHHWQRLLTSVKDAVESGLRPLLAMNAAATLPKALIVLGAFETVCAGFADAQDEMVALVHSTVHPLYENASRSHAFFVEGGESGTTLFGSYSRSKQSVVYVGTRGSRKQAIDLAVVKSLNLDHNSVDVVSSKLPSDRSAAIDALLVYNDQGTQCEDFIELSRI